MPAARNPLAIAGLAAGLSAGVFVLCGDVSGQPTVEVIVFSGTDTPNGNGQFVRADAPTLNDVGMLGFVAADANGTFISFESPAINDLDLVAFRGGLTGTSPTDVDSGIFRGSGGNPDEIVRRQDSAPDGDGVFTGFGAPAINEVAEVAFAADLSPAAAAAGVFRGDGVSLVQIARDGLPAPAPGGGTNGLYASFGADVSLNDLGQAAFVSQLSGTAGGASDDAAIFRGASDASAVRIAAKGESPPEGGGVFDSFSAPAINNNGVVAFRAGLSGTPGGADDDDGIYLGDGESLSTVLRGGEPAPDGDGFFELSTPPTMNEQGQLVFDVDFRDASPGTGDGVYFWDPTHGLHEVARTGGAFLDSTLTEVRLAARPGAPDIEHSGLNSMGQVAFSFVLANGDAGLAIWTFAPTPILAGVFNGDGVVDAADYARWRDHLGAADESALGGAGDGVNGVDAGDYAVGRAAYGTTPAAASTPAPVPSPSAGALGACATIVVAASCRRRR